MSASALACRPNAVSSSSSARWIDLDECAAWDEAVESAGGDVFHRAWFHRVAQQRGEGTPRLFVYRGADGLVVLPLLLRPLPDHSGYDATSVYGYAGPAGRPPRDRAAQRAFEEALKEHLDALGVICLFSRLHPMNEGSAWIEGLGDSEVSGSTVSIDVRARADERRACYRGSHRREIARLRREGYVVERGGRVDQVAFEHLYAASMTRLQADARYTFTPRHMRAFVEHGMRLLVVRHGRQIAAAGLFSTVGTGSHYFLSATADTHRKRAPSKLLIDAACGWAHAQGLHWLHLGGGVGGREDALFRFKAGFGPRRHEFRTWRWVLDARRYRACCMSAGVSHEDMFFPAYRSPSIAMMHK